jgi:hypothetical protein
VDQTKVVAAQIIQRRQAAKNVRSLIGPMIKKV